MSSTVTIGSGTATIYGTLAAAIAYLDVSSSEAAAAFRALAATPDEQKRKLVDATRYLNSLGYVTGYTTFAARDALDLGTGDADAAFPFRAACYELAALAVLDPDVLVVEDQGSNIARVYAGGAGVDYFSQTSAQQGTAPVMPAVVMALIGSYLATSASSVDGGSGATGSSVNPFGPCMDIDRSGAW